MRWFPEMGVPLNHQFSGFWGASIYGNPPSLVNMLVQLAWSSSSARPTNLQPHLVMSLKAGSKKAKVFPEETALMRLETSKDFEQLAGLTKYMFYHVVLNGQNIVRCYNISHRTIEYDLNSHVLNSSHRHPIDLLMFSATYKTTQSLRCSRISSHG